MAGSAGTILLEIDKFMIPQMEAIGEVAFYSVGIYIASVVAIPNRAMVQITHPITAKDLNEKNFSGVAKLYKQSSINLLVVGGLLFLLINLNVVDMYKIINRPQYSVGVLIVLLISTSELFKLALGTNGAILTNSKYYKMFFYLSIFMAISVIVLNKVLIPIYGINGAALATLITVFAFSVYKVIYVKIKLNIHPFSKKTIPVFGLVILLGVLFYFVNFPVHPFLNIVLKSSAIVLVYAFAVIKLNISSDLNALIKMYVNK